MPRVPRLHAEHPLRRWIAAVAIAIVASAIAMILAHAPGARIPLRLLDNVAYDSLFHARPYEDRTNGPIIIVAVDQRSIDAINSLPEGQRYGWPWPREFWAHVIEYIQSCQPKAIVFDMLFSETSVWQKELDDDTSFASAIDAAKMPLVIASVVKKDGTFENFAPPVKRPPTLGAANISQDEANREYLLDVFGKPSLALQTKNILQAGAASTPGPAPGSSPDEKIPVAARSTALPRLEGIDDSFLLRYYGPHQRRDGTRTYRYISAANVLLAAVAPEKAKELDISPDLFKDKIVLIGATAAGTYDAKRTPLSPLAPAVEIQATAIDNLLAGQRVIPLGALGATIATFLAALGAAVGSVVPRRVWLKLIVILLALAILIGVAIAMFSSRETVRWLPLAAPLVALAIATLAGLLWSYLVEDRQRRFILKALSQYVSPAVAEQLSRARTLSLGGQRRAMTVMFTDIAGFTDLAEKLPDDKLEALLHLYLGELSAIILKQDGTLDKYIGDAIMSFWNAPINQPHHAEAACRAALKMRDRERELQADFRRLGAERMLTRIGINSGEMRVGNYGSDQKFNYTVMGDQVNLGSRLEGANKIYGSQILIAQSTAELVRNHFLLRQVDVLRVPGKKVPVGVFELMAEAPGSDRQPQLASRFAEAFKQYQAMQWDAARGILLELARDFPDDGPTAEILRRIEAFQESPPPADWDGVYVSTKK